MPKQHGITEQSLGSAAEQHRQLKHSWNGSPLASASIAARYSTGPTGRKSPEAEVAVAVLVVVVLTGAGDPVHTYI